MLDKQIKNFNELASPIQDRKPELIERFVSYLGTKRFLIQAGIFILAYMVFNSIVINKSFDHPPFLWLNMAVSVFSLFTVTFVGISDSISAKITEKTTNLYHDYEFHVHNTLNGKLNDSLEKIDALNNKIDELVKIINESKNIPNP